jgi:serine protease Do
VKRIAAKRRYHAVLALGCTAAAVALATQLASGDTVITQPMPNPSATASGDAGAGLSADRIRQSIVTVEVPGRGVTGVAIVLDGDGRMLTSLAAVGANDTADVRYGDGHTVHTRVGHKDSVLDLALLVPLSGRFTTGLLASELDATLVELRTVSLATGRPGLVSTKIKGRVDAHAKDNTALSGATELDGRAPSGSPVLDPAGRVLGVVAHACRNVDGAACVDVSVVVPILSTRIFLSHTPSNAVPPSPWLGINGSPDAATGIRGVRVLAVAPHSPAERGGLHNQTDLIVVADGQPIDTPERLAEIVSKHAVGDVIKLSVFATGHYRDVSVTLQAPP